MARKIPYDVAQEVKERDAFQCQWCETEDQLTIHHILERKNGGDEDINNLITLCAPCHRQVSKLYDSGAITAGTFHAWLQLQWVKKGEKNGIRQSGKT